VIGEQLFDLQLWKPSRSSVAGGLAIGLFIALTPTLGIQMALAALAAYFLRVNIPVAVLACWLTNPVTAPVIYTLQYQLGLWVNGSLTGEAVSQSDHITKGFLFYAKPLWIGSLVSGTFFAIAAYVMIRWGWSSVTRLFSRS
jgi:uncharacterized protein (DUF2062 family)